ncbi:hypothetical protein TIFTF001_014306 [Ficus carica]|uniref:Retrotransposon gag domain-containing protein n=1 Tax=Ficus carica TaxID=3494 RepID=A0AA88DIF3_FICCA|nr:hypothetical protein TIFTF001_014306 [Ficus carica]
MHSPVNPYNGVCMGAMIAFPIFSLELVGFIVCENDRNTISARHLCDVRNHIDVFSSSHLPSIPETLGRSLRFVMAQSGEGSHYVVGIERDVQVLWAIVDTLDQKLDAITLEVRRALNPIADGRWYYHALAPNFHQFPYEFHLKLDIPLFDGRLHIEDFLDWLQLVDNCFPYMETPEHKRVCLVHCKLTGGALAWWEQIQAQRRQEGRDPVCSWSQIHHLLRGLFLPKDFEQTLYQQYHYCHQKLCSVSEYTEEFYCLSSRVDLQELELQLTTSFIMGLRDVIKDKLLLHSIWNLNDTVNLAYKVEEQLSRSSSSFT